MKILNESDRQEIAKMVTQGKNTCSLEEEATFIKRRKTILNAAMQIKDSHKSMNAKQNWRKNKHRLLKGIKRWHSDAAGKQCMRKIHKFNIKNNGSGYKGLYNEDFTREDALKALLSLQTHLIIESQYCIPDLDTHLSTAWMIENALEILEEITRKVRVGEDLDEEDHLFLQDLTP